jgi:tRNA A-37 threonylcarbamoyl transferase component Bud32
MPYCPTCNGRFQDGTFCPKDGTALLPDGESGTKSLVGQVIGGRFRLTKLLGSGGMGEVYIGEHIHITKKVAVKLLHPEISANREALIRFRQEAQSASSIGHDNIVAIDDFGTMDDGRVFLTMEFLQGQSMGEAMQARGGLDPVRALTLMVQVCDGLAAAHGKGIVHRDMKPENVFLTRRSDGSEVAKILDFGIAKVSGTDQNESLTRTGTVFGTPHYMSPEQALGQKLDHRADIYSVGVMLFEIFTGQVPFKAESFMGILSQHITKPAPRPSTVTPGRVIARPIEDIILKAMAKEADSRYATMKEMRDALKAVLDDTLRSEQAAAVRGKTVAFGTPVPAPPSGGRVLPPSQQPTTDDLGAPPLQEAMQPTMASVAPQAGREASAPMGYQPTMASVSPQAGREAPAGYQPTMMPPGPTGVPVGQPVPEVVIPMAIPKTVMASSGQQAYAAPLPTPMTPSAAVRGVSEGKSKTGLIVAIVGGVVLVGGGAVAAVVFWDKIAGQEPQVTIAGGTGTVAGTGSGGSATTAPKPDVVKLAQVEPKEEPKTEPKEEPTEEPKTEPKEEPTAGKKKKHGTTVETKAEPKEEPKTEPKTEPKEKPKTEPKPKAEPKHVAPKEEPKEECCTVRIDSIPSDALVMRSGKRLGRTPVVIKLDRGESVSVTFAKGGFVDTPFTFTASGNKTERVRLKKRSFGGPDNIPGAEPGGVPGSDPMR